MTEPAPTGPQVPQMLVTTGVAPGPDGRPWVMCNIQYGHSVHILAMPGDLADKLGPVLAEKLAEAASMARRAGLGLILPTPQTPPNGLPGGPGPLLQRPPGAPPG